MSKASAEVSATPIKQTANYRLIMGRLDGMMPHVPTPEMVKYHNWHVYRGDMLCYTAPHAECIEFINRMVDKTEKTV